MRTLVHLSDLHFGRVNEAVLGPLARRIGAIAPDVVVVSGDLTQRARKRQFRAARAFLDTLPTPQIVVPGNHDIPLDTVVARFLTPLRNYRRYIGNDLEPGFVDHQIAVVGVNTARSLTFKGGRINEDQV
ncbi:MAG: metallophosphoesterase family protein, partial [Burkholderiales bacterium]